MPTTDPTFGWPLPELADPPAGPQQMADLAAGIAATLTDEWARHYGQQVRSSTAAAGAGQDIPIAANVVITDAATGVYVVMVTGSAQRDTTTGTRHTVTVTANGATIATVEKDVLQNGPYMLAVPALAVHAGGTLTVAAALNTGNTGGSVRSNGRIAAVRVSP